MLRSYTAFTPRKGKMGSRLPSHNKPWDSTWIMPEYPAGCVTMPRVSTEAQPHINTGIGKHSKFTVGQSNQGRNNSPSWVKDYPSCECRICKKKVSKFSVHAMTLLPDSSEECLAIFELAKDDNQRSISGEAAQRGDALVKMVAPISQHVTSTSHPHQFHQNPSYCVDCLFEIPVYQHLSKRLMEELDGKAHLMRLPETPKPKRVPSLKGPIYNQSPCKSGCYTERPGTTEHKPWLNYYRNFAAGEEGQKFTPSKDMASWVSQRESGSKTTRIGPIETLHVRHDPNFSYQPGNRPHTSHASFSGRTIRGYSGTTGGNGA